MFRLLRFTHIYKSIPSVSPKVLNLRNNNIHAQSFNMVRDTNDDVDNIIKYNFRNQEVYYFNVITLYQFTRLVNYLSVSNTDRFIVSIKYGNGKNNFIRCLRHCGRAYKCYDLEDKRLHIVIHKGKPRF